VGGNGKRATRINARKHKEREGGKSLDGFCTSKGKKIRFCREKLIGGPLVNWGETTNLWHSVISVTMSKATHWREESEMLRKNFLQTGRVGWNKKGKCLKRHLQDCQEGIQKGGGAITL